MTGACRLLWPPLVVIDASCEAPWALSLVDGAKKMQTSAMKACFQIAECCFSSAKIRHFSAVCSFVEWLVKGNRSRMTRNSTVSCCVCAEYVNLEFWRTTFLFMNYQDSTKKKKCHFVSLSFCVIFEIQCHFRRYIINKYLYLFII